jgi:hypothetical protein
LINVFGHSKRSLQAASYNGAPTLDRKKYFFFFQNNFRMEFLDLEHCVKGRFCAQFGQKSLAPSSFDDRFKMHSICFAPFWLLLPFSTAHRQI